MREAIRDIDRLTTNANLVWETYTNDLPLLKKQIAQYMEEINNNTVSAYGLIKETSTSG